MATNRFTFVDETGTKKQDKFFVIGFLTVVNPDKYFKTLSIFRNRLFGMHRNLRIERVNMLKAGGDHEQLTKFARNPFKFELKYSKINNYNYKIYEKFVETLLDIGVHFVAIGIDREDPNFTDKYKLISSYKRIINQYLEKYGKKETCLIVDDFGIQIARTCRTSLLPDYYVRNLSESTIYLQAVDVIIGLIHFGLRKKEEKRESKKDKYRRIVLEKLEGKIGRKVKRNLTVHYNNKGGYFSTWILDFGKGHGH